MFIRPNLNFVSSRICPSFTKPILSRGLLTRQSPISFPKSPSTSVGAPRRHFSNFRNNYPHLAKELKVACVAALILGGCMAYISAINRSNTPMLLSSLEGLEWTEAYLKKHPEVKKFLLNDREIFGPRYLVFDELMGSLFALKWMLNNDSKDYILFTFAQPEEVKLSRESFFALREEMDKLLKSNWGRLSKSEIVEALEVSILLSHICQSKELKALLQPYRVCAQGELSDQHALHLLMTHSKQHFPGFDELSKSAKKLVHFAVYATSFRQIMRLEGGPGVFSGPRGTSDDCYSFVRLMQQCNFVGALGHVNYTQPVHNQIEHIVGTIRSPNTSSWLIYQTLLKWQGHSLGFDTFDTQKGPENCALTRIGAMFGCSTKKEGDQLKAAFETLPKRSRDPIITQLAGRPNDPVRSVPIGLPELFKNVFDYHIEVAKTQTKENNLSASMHEVLPFVADVLAKQQELCLAGKMDASIPLNFNEVTSFIRIRSPQILKVPFYIDPEGVVCLYLNGKT